MRKYIAALVAAIALLAPAAAHAASPTIYVENSSTVITDAQIADALPAFQTAVTQDLAPYWGTDATLVQSQLPPAGSEVIHVLDNSDISGALGYHWVAAGVPYAKVFGVDSLEYGGATAWQVTFTHELFEMLVDPYANRATLSQRVKGMSPRWWLTEVGDPVEADNLIYLRPGASGQLVSISDFITPAWYGGKGPYDFRRAVKRPLQILRGGYANYWSNGKWTSIRNFRPGERDLY